MLLCTPWTSVPLLLCTSRTWVQVYVTVHILDMSTGLCYCAHLGHEYLCYCAHLGMSTGLCYCAHLGMSTGLCYCAHPGHEYRSMLLCTSWTWVQVYVTVHILDMSTGLCYCAHPGHEYRSMLLCTSWTWVQAYVTVHILEWVQVYVTVHILEWVQVYVTVHTLDMSTGLCYCAHLGHEYRSMLLCTSWTWVQVYVTVHILDRSTYVIVHTLDMSTSLCYCAHLGHEYICYRAPKEIYIVHIAMVHLLCKPQQINMLPWYSHWTNCNNQHVAMVHLQNKPLQATCCHGTAIEQTITTNMVPLNKPDNSHMSHLGLDSYLFQRPNK